MKPRSKIQEHRVWHLRALVRSAGGVNAAARKLDRQNTYVTQMLSDDPNTKRNIGSKMAAHIESCFGLAPGSLDQPPPVETKASDPYLSRIAGFLATAPDDDKELVMALAEWVAKRRAEKSGNKVAIPHIELSSLEEESDAV